MSGERQGRRRPRRTGRRQGDSGTRDAILAAARRQFGERGYDGTTIRSIAGEAGVDAALVHHFFGTKERLFAAAVRLPVVPGELIGAALAPGAREPGLSLGEHLLRTVLGAWDVPEVRSAFLGMLRSAVTSEQAAAMMREFATEAIIGRIAVAATPGAERAETPGDSLPNQPADGGDAEFRAALVASQVLGLALTRYVLRIPPLDTTGPAELAAAIGPTLERYLSGDVTAPGNPPPGDSPHIA